LPGKDKSNKQANSTKILPRYKSNRFKLTTTSQRTVSKTVQLVFKSMDADRFQITLSADSVV